MSAAILISAAMIVSSCSTTAEPETAKTANVNQAPPVSSNSVNSAPPVLTNGNVPANLPNTAAPTVSSTSSAAPVVDNDKNKKSSPPVKLPTPSIGSGGDDMSLFMQARSALSSDQELASGVVIEIKEGNATLNGKVSSEVQKTKAEELVRNVTGIKSIKNNLRF